MPTLIYLSVLSIVVACSYVVARVIDGLEGP